MPGPQLNQECQAGAGRCAVHRRVFRPPKGIPASCPDLHAVAMKSKSQQEPAAAASAAASVGFGDCLILPASSADAKREDWT